MVATNAPFAPGVIPVYTFDAIWSDAISPPPRPHVDIPGDLVGPSHSFDFSVEVGAGATEGFVWFVDATVIMRCGGLVPFSANAHFGPFTWSAGAAFQALVPARLLESRVGSATVDGLVNGIGVRPTGSVTEVQVAGRAGVPVGAAAAVLNVTVADAQVAGFVTVYPCDAPRPLASNLNFVAGSTVPNAVVSKIAVDGKVCLFTSGATHLIADVNGYFPAG